MNPCEILLPAKYQITVTKNPVCPEGAHSHAFFELDCVKKGRCPADLGGHSFFLSAGSFVFLPPNMTHFIHSSSDCEWYQLLIAPDILDQLLAFSFENNIFCDFFLQSVFAKDSTSGIISHTDRDDANMWLLLDSMVQESQEADTYSDRMLFHLLLTFLYKLIRYGESTIFGSHDTTKSAHMAVIARYLLKNFTTASLAGLADQMNYSISYCSRFVQENTGFNFKQLQKKIRMQKAVSCLLYADMPIGFIAERLGYSSSENFMKVFKQEYGLTPMQYRRLTRGGQTYTSDPLASLEGIGKEGSDLYV